MNKFTATAQTSNCADDDNGSAAAAEDADAAADVPALSLCLVQRHSYSDQPCTNTTYTAADYTASGLSHGEWQIDSSTSDQEGSYI